MADRSVAEAVQHALVRQNETGGHQVLEQLRINGAARVRLLLRTRDGHLLPVRSVSLARPSMTCQCPTRHPGRSDASHRRAALRTGTLGREGVGPLAPYVGVLLRPLQARGLTPSQVPTASAKVLGFRDDGS